MSTGSQVLGRDNAVSLALCHARAVLQLLTEAHLEHHADAIETVIHFVDEAKALIDGPEAS